MLSLKFYLQLNFVHMMKQKLCSCNDLYVPIYNFSIKVNIGLSDIYITIADTY